MMKKLKNVHPGDILLHEFLLPLKISQNKLAKDMGVSPRRINEIVKEVRAITADTDLRLSKALGTSEGFWLSLQASYDLEVRRKEIKAQLDRITSLTSKTDDQLLAALAFAKNGLRRNKPPCSASET